MKDFLCFLMTDLKKKKKQVPDIRDEETYGSEGVASVLNWKPPVSLAPQESPSLRFHHRYVVSETLLFMNNLHVHVI